jgi:hypothetical protein
MESLLQIQTDLNKKIKNWKSATFKHLNRLTHVSMVLSFVASYIVSGWSNIPHIILEVKARHPRLQQVLQANESSKLQPYDHM